MKMLRIRTISWLILILAFTSVGLLFYGKRQLQAWAHAPLPHSKETIVELTSGMGLYTLASQLQTQDILSHGLWCSLYVKLFKKFHKFQAGSYRVTIGMTLDDLLEDMSHGRTYHPLLLEFSIPEGYTMAQILARIASLGVPLTGVASDPLFIQNLGIASTSLEGFLFPATYRFYDEKPTEATVLARMVAEFFSRLPQGYEEEVQALGLTIVEAVNMASLIEREAFVEEEKSQISEVIWNRYRHKISLGIDAALLYGLPDGKLNTTALRDKTNPYNTRIHVGLPPTPICSPSTSSLAAVLRPTQAGWYYYVLLPDTSKRHAFSRTLREHNQHVQALVREQKRQIHLERNREKNLPTVKKDTK
jgi:UPF0755 protein